jgi:hypothetical protein
MRKFFDNHGSTDMKGTEKKYTGKADLGYRSAQSKLVDANAVRRGEGGRSMAVDDMPQDATGGGSTSLLNSVNVIMRRDAEMRQGIGSMPSGMGMASDQCFWQAQSYQNWLTSML